MMKKIAIVIPCHNEEKGIVKVIEDIPLKLLKKRGYQTEVLVIDNNSTDRTAQVAEEKGARVIYEPKRGKGNAILAGFNALSDDTNYVVMLDGDNTYRPQEIFRLIEPLENNFCDVVVGSRLGGKIKKDAFKLQNRMVNWIYTFLVRQFYRANVTDVLSGYFAWKKEVIDELKHHLKSNGFSIEMEMITKMTLLKYEIYSVPITYEMREGETKIDSLKDGVSILSMLFKNLMWKPIKRHFKDRKLKIAIVTDSIYPYNKGGKEKRIYEISQRLAQKGHEVHIYSMKWWQGSKDRIENGVHLHGISRYYPLYAGRRRSIKEAVMFGSACLKLITKDFDVIDVDHMPHLILFPIKIVCLIKKKKMIVTWNEVWGRKYWGEYLGKMGIVAAGIEKLSVLLPDEIISISKHTTKKLTKELHSKKEIYTIPAGIDINKIRKIIPSNEKSDVIFAGRLISHKNVDILIKAIALARKTHPKIRCLIVGDGPEKKTLEALTKKLQLTSNVIFKGFLEDERKLYALIKSSRIFVLPSTREGFGIVVIEANASGIPVIAINHRDNAARDLIIEGHNGYRVNLKAQEIAQRIGMILDEKSRKNIKAYYPFIKDYDWGNISSRLLEIYKI